MSERFQLLLLPEGPFHRCLSRDQRAATSSLRWGAAAPAPLLSLNRNFLQTLLASLGFITISRISTFSPVFFLSPSDCVLHTAGAH